MNSDWEDGSDMAGESARANAWRARERAKKLNEAAARWERGAEGESRTSDALARLGPEWMVWHDVAWPGRRYANIDHVAVGPTGIFVIDSKNWSGSISTRHGVLRQNGYRREREVAGCSEAATAVGSLVPEHMPICRPVMCFTHHGTFDHHVRDVILCSTANLVQTLSSGPVVLDPRQAHHVARTLQTRLTTRSGQTQAGRRQPVVPAFAATPSVSRPRRRRLVLRRIVRGVFLTVGFVISFMFVALIALALIAGAYEGLTSYQPTPSATP